MSAATSSHLPKKVAVACNKTEEGSQDWQLGPLCQYGSPPAAQQRLTLTGNYLPCNAVTAVLAVSKAAMVAAS